MNFRHGAASNGVRLPEYNVWSEMKYRCYRPTHKFFRYYGGRGITVCDRWRYDFKNFFEDMGNRPGKGYMIDRIDNGGNYEPSNCRWATVAQSNRNKSNVPLYGTWGGAFCLKDWANFLGLKYDTVHNRLQLGMSLGDALQAHKFKTGTKPMDKLRHQEAE